MSSLEGLERLSPPSHLLDEIEKEIGRRQPLSLRQRLLVAAAVAGLLLLNGWAVVGTNASQDPLAVEQSTDETASYLPNYQIYE